MTTGSKSSKLEAGAVPANRRHSINAPCAAWDDSAANLLRKEQSSPAVVQQAHGHGSLLKQVVSASGQGCTAALMGCNGGTVGGALPRPIIWRTRSVRNKTESYCILHLKDCRPRGVTLEVSCVGVCNLTRSNRATCLHEQSCLNMPTVTSDLDKTDTTRPACLHPCHR